jgi:CBS domain-containing protein
MSHDVFTVRPDTPLKKAVGLLRRHRIGSLPVVKNRSLVGIITRSDILDFVLSGLSVRAPASTNRNNKKTTSAGRRTREKPRD